MVDAKSKRRPRERWKESIQKYREHTTKDKER